ncbi:cellulose biosynthesis protein BcsQ [Enterobacter asburiae]|nr:cellulose biosynthesis protein BcsQ [Enterobacter asburiae]
MPLICVCSPKGGTGITTLTATIAFALAREGNKALALDLDAQNALRIHFGVPVADGRGYAASWKNTSDWSQFVLTAGSNLFVLPYGSVTEIQRLAFEERLMQDEHFLTHGLRALLTCPELIIVADCPSGPSPVLNVLSPVADLHLVTLLADTASVSLLPGTENNGLTGSRLNRNAGHYFLLNQTDSRRQISRDVAAFVTHRLGDKLLGMVHRDESVGEAAASQQSLFDYCPSSAAAYDIAHIAGKVSDILGIKAGDGIVNTHTFMSGR